jgi:hypothetical protein
VNTLHISPVLLAVAVLTALYLARNARQAFRVGHVSAAVAAGQLTKQNARMVRLERLRLLLLATGLMVLVVFYISNLLRAPYWATIALLGLAVILLCAGIVVSVVIELRGGLPRRKLS